MSGILAIDPGTTQSGWVHFVNGSVTDGGIADNYVLLSLIEKGFTIADRMAIEMIANQGQHLARKLQCTASQRLY